MKIGVDLGGTNTVVGLCTDEGVLKRKASAPTKRGDKAALLQSCRRLAVEVCEAEGVGTDSVCQIGLGVPGSLVKKTRTLTFGTNLDMRQVCFAEAFLPEFSCPVRLDNDANCAALGEYVGGAGRGVRSMVMVTLGTGVGGGIVLGGKLYTGENDIAGEIGHMVVEYGGAPCNCGRRGCLETYASATGMIRLAREALEHDTDSVLHARIAANGGALDARMICDARDAGDALAGAVFESYVGYLACGLNNIVNVLQPQRIVLGGGVAGYGEKLLAPLRERVTRELMPADCPQGEVVLAQLGNDAGIIGAAMLEE